jgi:hypothetical protein
MKMTILVAFYLKANYSLLQVIINANKVCRCKNQLQNLKKIALKNNFKEV